MSRNFSMFVTISGINPDRTEAVQQATEGEWPFDGNWYESDSFLTSGGGGQRTIIIPTHDLVVVRLGHFRGSGPGSRILNLALEKLMEAIPESD